MAASDVDTYLIKPLNEYLSAPGKELRPTLCRIGCEIVGGSSKSAESACTVLELFHSAALIHDDIEDGALLRRGRPAFHRMHGPAIAINAGDYLLVRAATLLLDDAEMPDRTKLEVLGELSEMACVTIEGQSLDIGWARDGRWDMGIEESVHVARCKTACYTCSAPLAIGAIIGGGEPWQIETLRSAGEDAGVAFQIFDDIDNLTRSAAEAGKDCGSDIAEGKRTVIAAHALANSPRAAELRAILSSPECGLEDIARAIGIMNESGSVSFARSLAADYLGAAIARIEAAFENSPFRTELVSVLASFDRSAVA